MMLNIKKKSDKLIRSISGLSEISKQYDLFMFDQWGVLHDGRTLYPGVIDSLNLLRQMEGKILLIISNSSRESCCSYQLLQQMGLDPDLFDDIFTSGDYFLNCLRDCSLNKNYSFGFKYFGIHWPEGYNLPDDINDYQEVNSLTQADFILLTGLDRSLEEFAVILEKAVQRKIPMICLNPDLFSPEGNAIKPCPGQVARLYHDMGGHVINYGKPNKTFYNYVLQQYSCSLMRTIAIGDSLNHDIAGANNLGIATWFLYQGVHQLEWHTVCKNNSHLFISDSYVADILASHHKVSIDYVSQGLFW